MIVDASASEKKLEPWLIAGWVLLGGASWFLLWQFAGWAWWTALLVSLVAGALPFGLLEKRGRQPVKRYFKAHFRESDGSLAVGLDALSGFGDKRTQGLADQIFISVTGRRPGGALREAAPSSTEKTVTVLEESVPVYAEPSVGEVVAEIGKGSKVVMGKSVTKGLVQWVQVRLANGTQGFMKAETGIFRPHQVLLMEQVESHEEPAAASAVKSAYTVGTTLVLADLARSAQEDWVEIRDSAGDAGFIKATTRVSVVKGSEHKICPACKSAQSAAQMSLLTLPLKALRFAFCSLVAGFMGWGVGWLAGRIFRLEDEGVHAVAAVIFCLCVASWIVTGKYKEACPLPWRRRCRQCGFVWSVQI